MGTYMDIDSNEESLCKNCGGSVDESGDAVGIGEDGIWSYMPYEGAAACIPCVKPLCAKTLEYCDPVYGLAQQYTYYPTAEANTIICEEADPFDVCDIEQYCRDDAAQCRVWPDNRWNMTFPAPCPTLDGPDERFDKNFGCWDHNNIVGSLARGSSSPTTLTVAVPEAARMDLESPDQGAHCGPSAVQPQYRYFYIACKQNRTGAAAECTDFMIDCPFLVSQDIWWTGLADTLYDSNYTTDVHNTAFFETNTSEPWFQPLDGRTVHVIVNIYEDVNSTNKFGYLLKHHICMSRTKV